MGRMLTGGFLWGMVPRTPTRGLSPVVGLAAAVFGLFLISPGSAAAQLNAISVSSGTDHTCAIQPSGQVVCWGDNSEGQLGDGSTDSSLAPVRVRGTGEGDPWLDDARKIDAGAYHTCAVRRSGRAVCWGSNVYGQLGNGETRSSSIPVNVMSLYNARDISSGGGHTCAIRMTGHTLCWGNNAWGQIGDGGYERSLTPVPAFGMFDTRRVSAGASHTCAIRANYQQAPAGQVLCWGAGTVGQIGDGKYGMQPYPTNTNNLDNATDISVGGAHTCAIRSTGQAVCWGDNDFGQLGDGSIDGIASPVDVTGLADAAGISAGSNHTCAIRTGGQAVCWGDNESGQLGSEGASQIPVVVNGLGDASMVSAGESHSCAVRGSGENGLAVCWGGIGKGSIADGDSDNETWGDLNPIPKPALGRPKFAPVKITPGLKRARRGRTVAFRIGVRNTGESPARKVKVCGRGSGRILAIGRCVRLGRIAAGRSKTARIRVTVRRRASAGSRAKVRFLVTGRKAGKRVAGAVLIVR